MPPRSSWILIWILLSTFIGGLRFILRDLLLNRNKKSSTLRSLGHHPESKEELVVKDCRYGPYISDGKINASLNNSFDPESITLEQATELINEKRAKGPTKRKRRKKKK